MEPDHFGITGSMDMGKLNDIYIQESLKVILESIPEYTVTTVIAPMGYGKTTAITSFLKGTWEFCAYIPPEHVGG